MLDSVFFIILLNYWFKLNENFSQGKIFYATPSTVPSPSSLSEIIESAGGVMEKTRKSIAQIQELNSTKMTYFIITRECDLHLVQDVIQANIGKKA